MSPRGRSFAAVSSNALNATMRSVPDARPYSPATSTFSASSSSTLPPYPVSTPPPSYSPSSAGSLKGGKRTSSAVAMHCPPAPKARFLDLPEVKDAEAMTTSQTRDYLSPMLFSTDGLLDFTRDIPDLKHLGPATRTGESSIALTFHFSTSVYNVRSSIPGRPVSIDDVANFVHHILHKPLTEKDALRCNLPAAWAGKRLIDPLAAKGTTRFGGLRLSNLGGRDCVWLVLFS